MVDRGDMTFEFDFGMDEYRGYVVARDSRIIRMAERDGFQDAFIPAGVFADVDSKELVNWIRERIAASR